MTKSTKIRNALIIVAVLIILALVVLFALRSLARKGMFGEKIKNLVVCGQTNTCYVDCTPVITPQGVDNGRCREMVEKGYTPAF